MDIHVVLVTILYVGNVLLLHHNLKHQEWLRKALQEHREAIDYWEEERDKLVHATQMYYNVMAEARERRYRKDSL